MTSARPRQTPCRADTSLSGEVSEAMSTGRTCAMTFSPSLPTRSPRAALATSRCSSFSEESWPTILGITLAMIFFKSNAEFGTIDWSQTDEQTNE